MALRKVRAGASPDGVRVVPSWRTMGRGAAPALEEELGAGLEGADAVGAGGEVDGDFERLRRPDGEVGQDVGGAHGAQEAELALVELADGGGGVEGGFHVLRELALVVDGTGGAVGAARELVEGGDADLGTAAAGAEQVPAEREEAAAGGFEA